MIMAQISCPGGQCGVRHHIVGSESQTACNQLSQIRGKINNISGGLSNSSSRVQTSSKRSWRDKGYEGEFKIDPAGCGCSSCRSGISTPLNALSETQVSGLVGGTHAMDNRSGRGIDFEIEQSDDEMIVRLQGQEWNLDPMDFEDADIVNSFDTEGEPVVAA